MGREVKLEDKLICRGRVLDVNVCKVKVRAVPSINPRLIDAFSRVEKTDKRSKRSWNLEKLTEEIVANLSASPYVYVRVLGVVSSKRKAPIKRALRRAKIVRQGLMQWVGPQRFKSRYKVGWTKGSLDGQVEVWLLGGKYQ